MINLFTKTGLKIRAAGCAPRPLPFICLSCCLCLLLPSFSLFALFRGGPSKIAKKRKKARLLEMRIKTTKKKKKLELVS